MCTNILSFTIFQHLGFFVGNFGFFLLITYIEADSNVHSALTIEQTYNLEQRKNLLNVLWPMVIFRVAVPWIVISIAGLLGFCKAFGKLFEDRQEPLLLRQLPG